MSFWKPLIDWNASHKYHATNRSEAKFGIGVGIWKEAPAAVSAKNGQDARDLPVAVPYASPGDIHGAF